MFMSVASAPQLDTAAALLGLLGDTATESRADSQLEALTLAVSADLPVLLWGEPGIGKTAALNQLAAALDVPLTTVIASVHEPSDFSGLPVVGADPAVQGVPMAPPDWAVRMVKAGRGLLFLDELSTAPPAVQAAMLRLVLERAGELDEIDATVPGRGSAPAQRHPHRRRGESALVGGRRLGTQRAAGQPVRPSTVDVRP